MKERGHFSDNCWQFCGYFEPRNITERKLPYPQQANKVTTLSYLSLLFQFAVLQQHPALLRV